MLSRYRKVAMAAFVVALAISFGCGGSSLAPSPTPPPVVTPPVVNQAAQAAWNALSQEVKDYLLLPGNLQEMPDGTRAVRRANGALKHWADPRIGTDLREELEFWGEVVPAATTPLTVVASRSEANTVLEYGMTVHPTLGVCAWVEGSTVSDFTYRGSRLILAFGAPECKNAALYFVAYTGAHEIGHSLGLSRHTPSTWRDVMSEGGMAGFNLSDNLRQAMGFLWAFPPGTAIKP